ncbi:SUMO-specific isopeptidase USPL1 [Centroberyx gerrardi]
MVMFIEWHRTALDQKSISGLPMTGEDTGLGAVAPPLAGYLGKVQERAASLEYCPWCASKGLTYALRSYRINFQESIILCTNPECLFPLVSRPLEDVLANLVPVEPSTGGKRKNPPAFENEELIAPSPKRLRSNGDDSPMLQSVTDTLNSQAEPADIKAISNGQHPAPKTEVDKLNGHHKDSDCPVTETTAQESLQDKTEKAAAVLEKEPENAACTDGLSSPMCFASARQLDAHCSSEGLLTTDGGVPVLSPHQNAIGTSEVEDEELIDSPEASCGPCNLDSSQSGFTNGVVDPTEINTLSPQHSKQPTKMEQKARTVDSNMISTCKNKVGIKSEPEDLSPTTIMMSEEPDELVSVPPGLFWRNKDNLCWLDALLVALVNCKNLRKSKPKDEPQQSSVWQLITEYDEACADVDAHQQTGTDGVVRVPSHVLQKANSDLQSLRMSIFKLLQPKLHCKLGQRETPVFAMPLLFMMDSWVEPLFQLTFHWEFECSDCKAATNLRVVKPLPSFTNIVPDWHPLHAAHLAPCNLCCKKNQTRTMVLERVPPVFALHFVEGLPDSDVRIYSFNFQGKRYSVSMVIQYDQHLKHFVTWIQKPDGSWLEFDDLKHPHCATHVKLPVPAQDIHIVFWEMEDDNEPSACSPSTTVTESPPSKNEMNHSLSDKDFMADELLAQSPDQSLLISQNDTDIVCALTVSGDSSNIMDTTVTAGVDTSIGSTTMLDTFEGLTHNDIVTLTLVEVKDSEVRPLNDNDQTPDTSLSSRNEIVDSSPTPDSSSAVISSEMPHGPAVQLLSTPNTSDPETVDDSSSDPTFVPHSRRGRGRGKAKGKNQSRQKGKKAVLAKAAPATSPSASSEHSEIILPTQVASTAQDDDAPPVETTQQASPESSTETSPPPISQRSPKLPPSLDQNARWSYLLSRHPLTKAHSSIAKLPPTRTPTSITQVKPTIPSHSTPKPVRRQQTPVGYFPKPPLRREDSEALPLKAAEMYGAFSAKTSNTSTPPQTPVPSPLPFQKTTPMALHDGKPKVFQPVAPIPQKSLMTTTVVSDTAIPPRGAMGLPKISPSEKRGSQLMKVPPSLNETDALRYKLFKKLKAKKKKLAKLNQLLGDQGGAGGKASLRPDSTDLSSPHTVTSSTYDASTCGEFFADLISPATTASNLSPDSTGLLEMLTTGQDGGNPLDYGGNAIGGASQVNTVADGGAFTTNSDNFLEEFLSGAAAQQQTEMETEALSALDLFF